MNQDKWQLIMATPVPMEPYSMPAVNASGRGLVRQLRGHLWVHGFIILSLAEVRELVD